jgi:uncharacterized RDD family membrane protein YckC
VKIHIQTSQNVDVEYEVAGVGYRIIAALIDLSLFVGYYALIFILAQAGVQFPHWLVFVLAFPPVPILLYPLVTEIILEGQTIGKRAMSLKVVRTDGSQPTIGSYLLRWVFWLIEANPFLAFLGFGGISVISVSVTKYGQRVGDLAAGTTVVRVSRETMQAESELMLPNADYTPVWPQVRALNDRDIALIRKSLSAVERGADDQFLTRLANKVADVLGIDTQKIELPSTFLQRVVKDYNFVAGRIT